MQYTSIGFVQFFLNTKGDGGTSSERHHTLFASITLIGEDQILEL